MQVKNIDLLVHIARTLPPRRVEELLDFARFLEAQELARELVEEDAMHESGEEGARWDDLLRSEEGQRVLERLASEALEEYRAGKVRSIQFTPEGRMEPG